MNADLVTFKILFNEFDSVPDVKIQLYIDDAKDALDKSAWGLCYDKAVLWLTAHNLSMSMQRNANSSEDENGNIELAQTGVLTNATADGLTVGFAASPSASSDGGYWYAQSTYGQRYLALMKECLSPARIVRCGN